LNVERTTIAKERERERELIIEGDESKREIIIERERDRTMTDRESVRRNRSCGDNDIVDETVHTGNSDEEGNGDDNDTDVDMEVDMEVDE